MRALALTSSLALGLLISSVPTAAVPLPERFTFAKREDANWDLEAATMIRWLTQSSDGVRRPAVENVTCGGTSPNIDFAMNDKGQIESLFVRFLGVQDEDGERDEPTLLGDRLWLFIDDERWEFSNIPKRTEAFKNIDYQRIAGDEIILPVWRGHRAVRKNGVGSWVHMSRIYEKLIAARTLSWSFKSRDWTVVDKTEEENALPSAWETTRYTVDHSKLAEVISWCNEQLMSEKANELPREIVKMTNP